MPSITKTIPHGSDTARMILSELRHRVRVSETRINSKRHQWEEAENKTLAYLPEREVDTKRRQTRENGLPTYTTIQIPYSYAVLLSAHTYLTSVFLSRNPVMQFTGRHGEPQQNVQALEALIDYQVTVGVMLPVLYTWLYDAGKYGVGVIGEYWEERYENITSMTEQQEMDPMFNIPLGKVRKVQTTRRGMTYSGNTIYNIQPADFLWDVRWPIRDFQQGEYCGCRFSLGWNTIVRRMKQGYYMEKAVASMRKGASYDVGNSNMSSTLDRPEVYSNLTTDLDSFRERMDHPMMVKGYEVTVELIPTEWDLGTSDFPEKWVFTCTSDFTVLLGAQPQGAYHAKFPFHVLPLEVENYGIVPRGMPEILDGVQNTIDWLINSHFYNVRAALNNQWIVDPSKVVMKDLTDPLPGGIIRLKPEAYGQDVKMALQQFAVQDVTQNHLRDLEMMFGVGERTIGVNDQIMGMIADGGRKTATEVRTSSSFGINRLKTIAEYMSATGMSSLATMSVQNTQQYYNLEQQFKIAGDLMGGTAQSFMLVTPETIMGFYDYVPVDGTLPVDRFAQANLWKELMGQIATIPPIMMRYDLGRIFEWVAQLSGLKNITQFRLEVAPDAALAQAASLGNSVPMEGGPAQPAGKPTGQIPNLGPIGGVGG